MTPGETAEALIAQFCITDPTDLDLEAIAFDAGLQVEYRELEGCEATLVGFADKAIATIKLSGGRGRQRFSIGHEFGHWMMHRGQSFRCRAIDLDDRLVSNWSREKQANQFAAHILMPTAIFKPAVNALENPGFSEISRLATQFQTSLLATSLRLTMVNNSPAVLACYSAQGLRWHLLGVGAPPRWLLKDDLHEASDAYKLLSKRHPTPVPGKKAGSVWFQNDDARLYELHEHCVPYRKDEVLVMLYLSSQMASARLPPKVDGQRSPMRVPLFSKNEITWRLNRAA